MNKDIEKLIKIQDKINTNKFHLHINTDLKDDYRFALYINFQDERDYFNSLNIPILSTRDKDSVEDLENYLKKHDGFGRW